MSKRKVGDPSRLSPSRGQPSASTHTGPVKSEYFVSTVDFGGENKTPWWYMFYNKDDKTFCFRTCKGWLLITGYSIIYLIFLSTFTMILLYGSLAIIKATKTFDKIDKFELLTYVDNGIGLTATPTSENSDPVIWYRNGDLEAYQKYIDALNKLLSKRQKRDINSTRYDTNNLGPCGTPPYGYGDKPCILVRINKQINWLARPLHPDSPEGKEAPPAVKTWMQSDNKKLWLHCSGYNSYDKEHIGQIKYFPDPPGFDPDTFPSKISEHNPVIAVQVSDFTLGISLTIECKLWYDHGSSSVEFLLYVAPKKRLISLSE